MTYEVVCNEKEWCLLARQIADQLVSPFIFTLDGALGSGKTTFVRAVLKKLGWKGLVKSPTFTLVETYSFSDVIVHHFDLYRIHGPHELENIGFHEYFQTKNICFIEWPTFAKGLLPAEDLTCYIEVENSKRRCIFQEKSDLGKKVLDCIVCTQ